MTDKDKLGDLLERVCPRCQGNGEVVTDWERYMHSPLDENGDDAVEECPDCNGSGRITALLAQEERYV